MIPGLSWTSRACCNNLSFTFEGKSRYVHTTAPLEISLRSKTADFFSDLLSTSDMLFYQLVYSVATFCTLGSVRIMPSVEQAKVIPSGRKSWLRSRQTKSRWRAGELLHRWERTVKVCCWPCQLQADCFWWSLLTSMERTVSVSSAAAYRCQEMREFARAIEPQ